MKRNKALKKSSSLVKAKLKSVLQSALNKAMRLLAMVKNLVKQLSGKITGKRDVESKLAVLAKSVVISALFTPLAGTCYIGFKMGQAYQR